jgi:hypothetical protein
MKEESKILSRAKETCCLTSLVIRKIIFFHQISNFIPFLKLDLKIWNFVWRRIISQDSVFAIELIHTLNIFMFHLSSKKEIFVVKKTCDKVQLDLFFTITDSCLRLG